MDRSIDQRPDGEENTSSVSSSVSTADSQVGNIHTVSMGEIFGILARVRYRTQLRAKIT